METKLTYFTKEGKKEVVTIPHEITDTMISSKKEVFRNDGYTKSTALLTMPVDIFTTDNPTKEESKSKKYRKLVYEKYDEYIEYIKKVPESNTKWVFNIFDGIAEQDRIIFRNDDFIIIPSIHAIDDKNNFHILVIFSDKRLRSMRDLEKKDISLLESARNKTLELIKSKYDVDESEIKTYFHYPPSVWQLHLHFNRTGMNNSISSVEHSHSLDIVIESLNIDTDFYKKIKMGIFV